MRHFIVSDLHGNGNIYNSIMGYLDNLSKDDEITLHINGDLIDRGWASAYMLLDVKNRIQKHKGFKIEYLAGNHELMMYQNLSTEEFIKRREFPTNTLWLTFNGGDVTVNTLKELIKDKEYNQIIKFISGLKLYHKFYETINDKRIVLAHSKCPNKVYYKCPLSIKNNNQEVNDIVWTRKKDKNKINKIGDRRFFTIIGHTVINSPSGYFYDSEENTLNIDGGCAAYVMGVKYYDHTPLVEIDSKNNRLIILTFNNDNEIIRGEYFNPEKIVEIKNLNKYKKYINKNVKVKKMYRNKDGEILFE